MASILLVDDSAFRIPQCKKWLERALEIAELEGRVYTAIHPNEAIRIYLEEHELIELVVLDYNMPDMNGMELLRNLLKVSQTKAILWTASEDSELKNAALGAGFQKVLPKKPPTDGWFIGQVVELLKAKS